MTNYVQGRAEAFGDAVMPPVAELDVTPAGYGQSPVLIVELPLTPTNPETALLLASLRWPVTEAARVRTASLAASAIDWSAFLSLVARHRVFGLAESGLRAAGVAVPEPHGAALRERANQASWGELILSGELRAIQEALHAKGVRPTILKGLGLSMKAYGRLGLRYNRDIDMLVPAAAVPPACDILAARGYERIEPPADAGPDEVRRWIRRQKDIVYQHPGKGLMVELHWRLFDNPHLLPYEEHGRRDTISLAPDFTVEVLPDDLDLIFICAHGALHGWSRLKWIADANAVFAQMPPAELLRVYHAARVLRAHRMVAQALILSSCLLGLAIPAEVVADSRADWRMRFLARAARHSILSGGATEIEDLALGSTSKNMAHYLMTDGVRYYWSELLFDLTDLSGSWAGKAPALLLPLIRIYLWAVRHAKIGLRAQARPKPRH